MEHFEVIYKILKTLERNMGNEAFEVYQISAEKMKIPYEQWEQLMILLADAGYITGIVSSKSLQNKFRHILEPMEPCITMKGLEYLAENRFMVQAKEVLKMTGEI